ncbi:MAG: hypothetical protein WD749_08685 [Phycisphaerales bacterium]
MNIRSFVLQPHPSRAVSALLLGAILVLMGPVSCQSVNRMVRGQPKPAEYTSNTTAESFRGVYDGTLDARPPQQRADVRLILGKESYLTVSGKGTCRLVLDKVEPRPPQYGQKNPSEALVFRADIAAEGGEGGRTPRVTVTPGGAPRGPKGYMTVGIEWGLGGGSHTGYLSQPVDLFRGGSASTGYFKYADWRTLGRKGGDPKAELEATLKALAAQENWKCLAGRNLTVRPGQSATFAFDSGWTPRMYLFCCDDGADRLAIHVKGRKTRVLAPHGAVKHPAVMGEINGTGEFNLRLHEEDPALALTADQRAEPVTVTILTLGNTLGDYGPLYPKEQAIADIAAPFVMAVGVGLLLDQASGGPERRAADRAAAADCRRCDGTGYVSCTVYGCLNGSVNRGGWVSPCSGCTAGKATCTHPLHWRKRG